MHITFFDGVKAKALPSALGTLLRSHSASLLAHHPVVGSRILLHWRDGSSARSATALFILHGFDARGVVRVPQCPNRLCSPVGILPPSLIGLRGLHMSTSGIQPLLAAGSVSSHIQRCSTCTTRPRFRQRKTEPATQASQPSSFAEGGDASFVGGSRSSEVCGVEGWG